MKRRISSFITRRLVNPFVRRAVLAGLPVRSVAILETIGRRSGEARRMPVGNGLEGDTFWLVAEHGTKAAYVRNIAANPRVRVFAERRWRSGTAHLMPEDDPVARQNRMWNRSNARVVRLMGSELLTVRIELDPVKAD